MITKYKIIVLTLSLIYSNLIVYAAVSQDKNQIAIPLDTDISKQPDLITSEDDEFLEKCLSVGEVNDQVISMLLTKILSKPNFLLPNKNWWLIKLFFMLTSPLSASVNNLVIATNSNITPSLILVTQFPVPLYIINVCCLLDKLKINCHQGIKHIINNIKKNKVKSCYSLINILVSIYLAYLSTLIDSRATGDAYVWIFSYFTDSTKILDIAYNLGYFLAIFYKGALNGVFFFNLINEIFHKTGIGYLLKITPSLKVNEKELSYNYHKNKLKNLIRYGSIENSINKSINYLKNRNLNTVSDIANLQLHCSEENYHKKSTVNVYINVFKCCFIFTITAFCAEASRQIYTSKLILKEFIEKHANSTVKDSYTFLLNNNQTFTCNSIDNCIHTMDIDAIDVNSSDISDILSLNRDGIIANILKGIGVAASTASIIIILVNYIWKIKTKPIFKKTLFTSYFQRKNIIPSMVAGTLFISGYYYMKNIYDVSLVAEKSNDLLQKSEQVTFMPVTASVLLTISSLVFTFFRGMYFLVDMTRTIMYLLGKRCN
jgi:hypothetical protein